MSLRINWCGFGLPKALSETRQKTDPMVVQNDFRLLVEWSSDSVVKCCATIMNL